MISSNLEVEMRTLTLATCAYVLTVSPSEGYSSIL